ncbi:GFA family protein [Cribrihabitans sp. XS_ASV171]
MEHEGTCYCGRIALIASGDPAVQCYCHCSSCRRWSGQPVTACLLWPEQSVRFTGGKEHLHRFSISDDPEGGKFSCSVCGGSVCTFLPRKRMYDIFAGVLPGFQFRPAMHINYAERVLSMDDGLPKFRDMPESAGGSGLLIGQ